MVRIQACKRSMRHSIQNPEADRLRPLRPARPEHHPTPLIRIKASTQSFNSLTFPSEARAAADLFSSLPPGGGTDEPPEPNIWDWLSAARKAAFSIRSWSTSARHSSHRRFASSAEASAASSSWERDSSALTCLWFMIVYQTCEKKID